MRIKEKIETYIKSNTRDGFHDASLLAVDFNFESKGIEVEIEHMRDLGDHEIIIKTKLIFLDISEVKLENQHYNFCIEDEIYSFDISEKNNKGFIQITGIKGWVLSFLSANCEISEEQCGEY